MKKLICILFIMFCFFDVLADHLPVVFGTGVSTTKKSDTYVTAATTGSLDVTGLNAVLVLSSFEITIDLNQNFTSRESTLKLTDLSQSGSEVTRYLQHESGGDKGLGGLMHVFDVSAQTGMKTYSLQHKTNKNNKDNIVEGNVVAIGLTTAGGEELSYSFCQNTSPVPTTPDQWTEIPALVSDYVSLPFAGNIYVSASINAVSTTGGSHVADWKLQYCRSLETTWLDFGKEVSRTFEGNNDKGLGMVVALLENVTAGDYKFRLVHKGTDANVHTTNSNLVALSLATTGTTIFPAFAEYSDPDNEPQTNQTVFQDVLNRPIMPDSSAALLHHAQFSINASGQSNAPEYTLTINNGATTKVTPMQQYINDATDIQAGSIVGLTTDLVANQSYLASLQHKSTSGITLTSSQVSYVGIMLADKPAPGYWQGTVSDDWHNGDNWFDWQVPAPDVHVTIPNGCNWYPVLDQDASCLSITIETGGYCELSNGLTLTVTKDVYLEEGASFIEKGTLSIGGSVYVDVSMEKHIYHYMSTPVDNTATVFSALHPSLNLAEGDDFFYWDEGNLAGDGPLWINIRNSSLWNTSAFEAGRGYAMSFNETAEDQLLTFKADAFNKGDYHLDVSRVPQNTSYYYSGWNLIGNPYPSNIDIIQFLTHNESSIWGAAYFWDEGPDWEWPRTTDYAAINELGSIKTGGNGNSPTNYAGVGQAFMVYCSSEGTSQVTFTDDMRYGDEAFYFKNDPKSFPELKISLQHEKAGYNELLIGFRPDATKGMDHFYDAPKLGGNPNFCISMDSPLPHEGKHLCIQGLPLDFGTSVEIPLNIYCSMEGPVELNIEEVWEMQNFAEIFILQNDQIIPFTKDLPVVLDVETGVYDKSYSLLLTSTNNIETNHKHKPFIYFVHNKLMMSNMDNVNEIRIFSIDGRLLSRSRQFKGLYLPKNQIVLVDVSYDGRRFCQLVPLF